jgi:hypothetical protein
MQELSDIHKILGDSGMKIISKEIFERAFAKQHKLISIKNRVSNMLLLASTMLFLSSSALSFFTVVYVRGILPKENNEVKDNPVAAISSPIAKIEENPDVKILQQEVAPVEVVKPAIKDKSRKKRAEQKAEPITVVEQKVEPIIDQYGTKRWYLNGKLHRLDGPAIERVNGGKSWYLNGELHREGGPAIEWVNGHKSWYINGELHREGGPAIEFADGGKSWYINGRRHREGGPAIELANGHKSWYLNGVRQK